MPAATQAGRPSAAPPNPSAYLAGNRSSRRSGDTLNPWTGRSLKPGQRLPSSEESDTAGEEWETRCSSPLPEGSAWEITPTRAASWLAHRFRDLINSDRRVELLTSHGIDAHELMELILDLDCYAGMEERFRRGAGPQPPDLVEYLSADRERWGWFAKAVRLFRAQMAGKGTHVIAYLRLDLQMAGIDPDGEEEEL